MLAPIKNPLDSVGILLHWHWLDQKLKNVKTADGHKWHNRIEILSQKREEAKGTTHLKGMGKTPHVKAAGRPESVDPMQMCPKSTYKKPQQVLRLRSYPKLMKRP